MLDGDHKIKEESVDVDSNVGVLNKEERGLHLTDVTPASCPIRRASNVIENCCVLRTMMKSGWMPTQELTRWEAYWL